MWVLDILFIIKYILWKNDNDNNNNNKISFLIFFQKFLLIIDSSQLLLTEVSSKSPKPPTENLAIYFLLLFINIFIWNFEISLEIRKNIFFI